MEAYLDNSATTPLCPEAVDAVNAALVSFWGNPSSLYSVGIDAAKMLDNSRHEIASKLSCRDDEIYFTSGGTEGNNLAVFGAAHALRRRGKRIVISSIEHPSIDEAAKKLETEGFEVVRVPVDENGRIIERDLFRAVTGDTVLVSIMMVNNEVGTIQPVELARRAVMSARSPALVHCDAVQAFGKLKIKPVNLGVDLMTLSSHKIHGPKGAGALYVRKGVTISPRTYGGAQENKLRPGTEPVPNIAGFAAAASVLPDVQSGYQRAEALRDYLIAGLSSIDSVIVNSPSDALPYVTNVSVMGLRSETMLNLLSSRGVYVSSGSACSKGKKSRVLKAMGLSDARIDSALRISFSRYTNTEHIDMLIDGLAECRKRVRGR